MSGAIFVCPQYALMMWTGGTLLTRHFNKFSARISVLFKTDICVTKFSLSDVDLRKSRLRTVLSVLLQADTVLCGSCLLETNVTIFVIILICETWKSEIATKKNTTIDFLSHRNRYHNFCA
jgi:hypothetical protein